MTPCTPPSVVTTAPNAPPSVAPMNSDGEKMPPEAPGAEAHGRGKKLGDE